MTGVKPSTQYKIIQRWARNGFRVVEMKWPHGPKKMLRYEDRVKIANPDTLMRMQHLGLA